MVSRMPATRLGAASPSSPDDDDGRIEQADGVGQGDADGASGISSEADGNRVSVADEVDEVADRVDLSTLGLQVADEGPPGGIRLDTAVVATAALRDLVVGEVAELDVADVPGGTVLATV